MRRFILDSGIAQDFVHKLDPVYATAQQIDVQIAAIARQLEDCSIVTTDSDLYAVPGLKVENWRHQPAS